jgi:hypothetical protein
MQHEPHSQSPSSPAPTAESLDSAALARRRALLKGLSKGGAVAAAVAGASTAGAAPRFVPTSSTENLVNVKTSTGVLCTVSGQQSAVMSRSAVVNTCKGFDPSHYVTLTVGGATPRNWPNGLDPLEVTLASLYPDSKSARKDVLVLTILADLSKPDEAYWIAAYFNALLSSSQTLYFPYSTDDLQTQHASPDPKYLAFYKAFLSSP